MARPKENTDRVTFFIASEKLAKLKELADGMGMSVSAYVRMLVLQHLMNN